MPRQAWIAVLGSVCALFLGVGTVAASLGDRGDAPDASAATAPSRVPDTTETPPTVVPADEDLAAAAGRARPAFEDTFDGTLDGDKWTTCYWWADRGCQNGSSGELQWYTPGQVIVDDGHLSLVADDSPVRGGGATWNYRSGMVTTGRSTADLSAPPRFAFTYGRVEVVATVPPGQGLWPAVWLLPISHESIPEIDIIEVYGHATDTARFTTHFAPTESGRTTYGERPEVDSLVGDLAAGPHTYGLTWTADRITWDIDGRELWAVDRTDVIPAEPMYLIINLAVGGERPGSPDSSTAFPAAFRVDSVRIWSDNVYRSGG